jgi:hypothetical protein
VRTAWEQRSGLTFDPWADIASIIGTLDDPGPRRKMNAMFAIETARRGAVGELTRPAPTDPRAPSSSHRRRRPSRSEM